MQSAGEQSAAPFETDQSNIDLWRLKKFVKNLQDCKGNGTSMISLIIPPKDQVSRINALLTNEYGTASNIKSRVNRQSVLDAITSTQQRLKHYTRVPPNGLCLFCGTIVTAEGKEKMVTFDIEPFRPINTSLYMCDNKFHIQALADLLESDLKFGFIVMDGNGTLFGTVSGNTREILQKITVDLPKKHGRGGQSALRFSRLRLEKRHNYVRKVAELSVLHFITNDKVNVTGLILAGSAEFKTDLQLSNLFDPRLAAKVLKTVDVSYGGENGFNQAIDLSQEILSSVKLIQEKRVIEAFFREISLDTQKYCYGVEDTMRALELGAVETLLVWDALELVRFTLQNTQSGALKHVVLERSEEEKKDSFNVDGAGTDCWKFLEKALLIDFLTSEYRGWGCVLALVTDRSQEGSQFAKGFGGLGGILRYPVDMGEIAAFEEGALSDD